MNPQLQNSLADLAARLGTTADKLWPILVAHARAEAIIEITGFSLLAIASGVAIKFFYTKAREEEIFWVGIVLSGLICFGTSVGVISNISDLIYPQAAAIHALVPHTH